MEHINRIELQGHVGMVRTNEYNGSKVANFSLATEIMYKLRDGNAVSETPDLQRIVKGTPVNVCGRLRSSKYTSADGTEKYFYEVLAQRVRILNEDEA